MNKIRGKSSYISGTAPIQLWPGEPDPRVGSAKRPIICWTLSEFEILRRRLFRA
jgi:hypothetical protein